MEWICAYKISWKGVRRTNEKEKNIEVILKINI